MAATASHFQQSAGHRRKASAPWRNRYLPVCFWWQLSIRDLTKGRTTGSRCGLVLPIYCSQLRCGGRVLDKIRPDARPDDAARFMGHMRPWRQTRPHWEYAAELVLIAATTAEEADIERATAQMERALRRDNWL